MAGKKRKTTALSPEKRARLEEMKTAILQTDGSVSAAALLLGLAPRTLTYHLNHRFLCVWWAKFKEDRRKKKQNVRAARAYQKKKAIILEDKRKLAALKEMGVDVDSV